MLKKIVAIKNIGTFRNHNASGDIEHRKLTLIHAENGRGKTTLCAILRSLRNGDSNLIQERKTLDSVIAPQVGLLFDHGTVEFKAEAWATKCPNIEIFDGDFITENVYSGDVISHDHKRNLCRVVLGAEGVKLADKLDGLVTEERVASTAQTSAKGDVDRLVPLAMTIDGFLTLKIDTDVDDKIAKLRKELTAQESAEAIAKRPELVCMTLNPLAVDIVGMLGKTIEGISADAAERVRQHIEAHFDQNRKLSPEAWLAEGVHHVNGELCPMCAQSLASSSIIGAMRDYFSDAYRDFEEELRLQDHLVRMQWGSAALLALQRFMGDNNANAEFWMRYVKMPHNLPVFERDVQPVMDRFQRAIEPLLEKKLASPLEAVHLSAEAIAAIRGVKEMSEKVNLLNEVIPDFNRMISEIKHHTANANIESLSQQIAELEAQKLRYQPETLTVVTAYEDAKATKSMLEQAKDKAREDLDEYNEKVIGAYHGSVNDLLERFGAGFRLKTVKVEYTGRTPRAAYSFEIRGKEVELGSNKTPTGTPSFRNTLSAGDRSTLAMAFFIAQVHGRSDIANLIVVFDDPFTSLDSFRQTWTCSSIRKIAESAMQVIVLSHSLDFLRLLSERCEPAKLKALQIAKHGRADSHIIEFDLNDATTSQVEKDVIQLRGYRMGDHNEMPATIRCIRPVLENFIRKTAPDHCPPGAGWLGGFLGTIQAAADNTPLAALKPMYDDLDALNSYTSPFHHDSGKCPTINSNELEAQVDLTLQIIGRA